MKNIILIGMPGSGKTTIGKLLAKKLNMNFLDFDDDIIEKTFNKTVGEKLKESGEEKFLEMEEKLALKLNFKNTVLSTSGSIPLSKKAIAYLKTLGTIIYIDIPIDTIEARLERMKVDRVIGMFDGTMTINDVLNYRKDFYEKSYDYKFSLSGNLTKEQVFEEFINFFNGLGIK